MHNKKTLIENISQKITDGKKQKEELDMFTCDLSEIDSWNGYIEGLETALKEIEHL